MVYICKDLKPYETKSIINVRYMGRQVSNHTAFVCIKTNLNQLFIITLNIEVSDEFGLYTPVNTIDFGTLNKFDEHSESKIGV